MRKKLFCLVVFLVLSVIACQQKENNAMEEKAVKTVVESELAAIKNIDYEGIGEFWAHEPYVIDAKLLPKEVGWKALNTWLENTARALKKEPGKFKIKELRASNYDIRINGNVSFVMYDEYLEARFGDKEVTDKYRSIKYLEKRNGQWKIVAKF